MVDGTENPYLSLSFFLSFFLSFSHHAEEEYLSGILRVRVASAKDLKAKQGDNVCLFVIIFVPLSVCWFVV